MHSNFTDAACSRVRNGEILQANNVTVGKYKQAIPTGDRFAVLGIGGDKFFYVAQDAIDEFLQRVGDAKFMEAVQQPTKDEHNG